MKYERTKLLEAARAKLEKLKANKDNVVAMAKYHADLKDFKEKLLMANAFYVKALKSWNPGGSEPLPSMPHIYAPQRPYNDNSAQIKRIEHHIAQLEMCADEKIEIKQNGYNYDFFYDLLN